ncbi:unnamed protein product [Moneuplotes crassus]|uniref:Dihydroorotate dehydrogenase catalytic domain-containing protein n=1 Tax=Euplotes crassus TaxID=5936 RepID=A0AAD1UJX2_EUPCR|nr:unnamed protein product [Moneuplotes crassus]
MKKTILTAGLLGFGATKTLQYSSENYPEETHRYFWSKIVNKYYNGSPKNCTHKNFDKVHYLASKIMKYRLFPKVQVDDLEVDLSIKYGEYTFKNPLGSAAGIDKASVMIDGLSNLGFGFVEVGDLSLEPEKWTEKPAYIDCYQKGIIERKSVIWKNVYYNSGIQVAVANMWNRQNKILDKKFTPISDTLVGLTIVPSKTTIDSIPYLIKSDYEQCIEVIVEFSDYIVINITERDKSKRKVAALLREENELRKLIKMVRNKLIMTLGKVAALEYSKIDPQSSQNEVIDISQEVRKVIYRNSLISKNNVPLIFLKVDSYLSEEEYKTIAKICEEEHVDGIVVGSTVPINVGLKDKSQRIFKEEVALGGAGGEITQKYSNSALKTLYTLTKGNKLLISNGGISTGKDMYERMSNGANLVQIYSALFLRGPYAAKYILEEFSQILKNNNETAQSIIGKNSKV